MQSQTPHTLESNTKSKYFSYTILIHVLRFLLFTGMGLTVESQFIPSNKLPYDKKVNFMQFMVSI